MNVHLRLAASFVALSAGVAAVTLVLLLAHSTIG